MHDRTYWIWGLGLSQDEQPTTPSPPITALAKFPFQWAASPCRMQEEIGNLQTEQIGQQIPLYLIILGGFCPSLLCWEGLWLPCTPCPSPRATMHPLNPSQKHMGHICHARDHHCWIDPWPPGVCCECRMDFNQLPMYLSLMRKRETARERERKKNHYWR